MELTWQMYAIVCPLIFLAGFVDSVAGGGTPRTDGKINAGIKCKSCRTFFSFEILDQAGYSKNIQCPYCLTTHTVTFHGDGLSYELTY